MMGVDVLCLFLTAVFSASISSDIFSLHERLAAGCCLAITVATWMHLG